MEIRKLAEELWNQLAMSHGSNEHDLVIIDNALKKAQRQLIIELAADQRNEAKNWSSEADQRYFLNRAEWLENIAEGLEE
ncbi:hypothetical protein HYS94_05730 [Candidatus Daviesbacteria bacterium]|nr:hypothetical protein [Candidatus Daviesbacteria bacterium]